MPVPILYIGEILKWADAYHARWGKWPTRRSGPIPQTFNDTWHKVDNALVFGYRGLLPGTTLALLLMEQRGARHRLRLPRLTQKQILRWADHHRRTTGSWPTKDSGPVKGAEGETWKGVHHALAAGYRGWPGGYSLARLLASRRAVRNNLGLPKLTDKKVLDWAEAHHARTKRWPTLNSGPIAEAPEETWKAVHMALVQGGRGLEGGTSLARLLTERLKVRTHTHAPRLTLRQIWTWILGHKRQYGVWPSVSSGPVPNAPGETWLAIDQALRQGYRGLKPGSSLAKLKATRAAKRVAGR